MTAETRVVGKIVSRNNKIPVKEMRLGNVFCSAEQMIYKATLRYVSGLVHHCPRVVGTICLGKSPSLIAESDSYPSSDMVTICKALVLIIYCYLSELLRSDM